MRINIAPVIALFQILGSCQRFVRAENESFIDHTPSLKLTTSDVSSRALLDTDNKSFKKLLDGLKANTKGDKGDKKSHKDKKAPKKGKGSSAAKTCTLCESGVAVGNPNSFAAPDYLNNVTCSQIDSFLRSFVQPDDWFCWDAQYSYSYNCGCCPGICPKGEKMSYPNRIVPYDINENGIYDDTCADLDTFFKLTLGGSECYMTMIASEYCGCKTYEPGVCTPCYKNAQMPNMNKSYNITEWWYSYNYTCGETAMNTLSDYSSPTYDCDLEQTNNAINCDCPFIPPSFQSSCSICFPNETLSTSLDPIFDEMSCTGLNTVALALGSILFDNSCAESSMINELLVNSTVNGRATCCKPKTTTPGLNGNKAKSTAKEVSKDIDWKVKKEEADAIIAGMRNKIDMKKKMKSSSQ